MNNKLFPTDRFFLIAGPCALENETMPLEIGEHLAGVASRLGIPIIFKGSFDKANRSSGKSFRGVGLEKGMEILAKVRSRTGLKVISDVHSPDQVAPAAAVLDALQLPAFLARQTDFYVEAGKSGKPLNVKKGQFMSPYEMKNAVEKFKEAGGSEIALTERGSSFGYGNLVVDFRSVPIMQSFGVPYVFDATHSLQLPAARGESSGGERKYLPVLARAQMAAGANGLFMEVHPDPAKALSDRETQWPLLRLEALLKELLDLYQKAKSFSTFDGV